MTSAHNRHGRNEHDDSSWAVHRQWFSTSIDERLHLLKRHLPYHESDHVPNIADNILTGGACLDGVALRRNDEIHMGALAADRIPDPTPTGWCRRRRGSAKREWISTREVRAVVPDDRAWEGSAGEGVVCAVGSRTRKTDGSVADGVSSVLERGSARAVSDRSDRLPDTLSHPRVQ